MKKLFLTSILAKTIKEFLKILPDSPENLTIALIPAAADPYDDKWFVEEDRIALKKAGFNIVEIDIKGKTEKELRDELRGMDVIYVAGGNTFYFLEKARESGFDKIIKELVEEGTIYAGASAGAVLVGPTIEPIKSLDDPSKAPSLNSFKGLGLVDFVVLPHFGEGKYKEKYMKIIEKYSNKEYKIVPITNRQAVVVENNSYKVVGS